MSALKWLIAGVLAIGLHAAGAMVVTAVNSLASPISGAEDVGEQGVHVGLGMDGDLTELLGEEVTEATEVEPEPKPEPKPEPLVEQAPAFTPVKSDTPAGVAIPESASIPEPTPAAASDTKSIDKERQDHLTKSVAKRTRATGKADHRKRGGRKGSAQDFQLLLMAHLNRHKTYPATAKKAKLQGTVELQFSIDQSGQVLAASIRTSSGHTQLDAAALEMLRLAEPLPSFPDEFDREVLTLAIPVEYSLITK